MTLYVATFADVAVSAEQDLLEIVAPADRVIEIREIVFGQSSDEGDAAAELLPVRLMRGHTSSGNGTAITPAPYAHAPGSAASGATVERNAATLASGGSPVTLRSETFNVAAGYRYYPAPDAKNDERIRIGPSQRFVVRMGAPADELTMSGTILYDEKKISDV